jgi:hypothetical protein
MPLSTGDRLGVYEVVAPLGYGSMGEVYRARDTQLGRDVAIKVLPAAFANDPDRLARLEREARLISQVNHPNICTLFHVVEDCLILELVEGETVQQRLIRGPLPIREALRHAASIAAALEAAHSKGIVHRDLKPANIKITSAGTIKVLDFGIAKLAEAFDSSAAPDITAALGGATEGALVGTVAYTSPEQAMGERVDRRSDIWAFGCVLYEMLTARRAFHGTAVADTLGAVMRGEPDWSALPAATPPEIRKLLRRCLEKDRGQRLADIADARLEIDDLLNGRSETGTLLPNDGIAIPGARRRGALVTALAFLAGVALTSVVGIVVFNRQVGTIPPARESAAAVVTGVAPSPPPSVAEPSRSKDAAETRPNTPPPARANAPVAAPGPVEVSINLPAGVTWAPTVGDKGPNTILALSPNGRRLVYSARTNGTTALWLRALDRRDDRQLPGTEGGISPFWSPDGASIGFFADDTLKKIDLNGSAVPVTLCAVSNNRGGAWGPDDTIVFGRYPGGLKSISSSGGVATPVTQTAHGEAYHGRPHFLAGTGQLLYRATGGNPRNAFYVTSLGSSERHLLMETDAGNVVYAAGRLLFLNGNNLMAQPFDLERLTMTGPPVRIAENVHRSTGSAPVFGIFSASRTGALAYRPQGAGDAPMKVVTNWTATSKH